MPLYLLFVLPLVLNAALVSLGRDKQKELITNHKYYFVAFYILIAGLFCYAFVMACIVFTSLAFYDYSDFGYYPSVGLGFQNAFLFLLMIINCLYFASFFKLVLDLRSFYIN